MQKITCNTQQCFICEACIPEWRELIALHRQSFRYKKGERIFTEGDPFTGIYCTLSGAVKVHRLWGDAKEIIIRFVAGNDLLGLRGLGGTDSIFPVSATALETTDVCFIPQGLLEASLRTNPDLTYKLMHFYAAELQKAEARMSELAHMEVKGRIARGLQELARVFGTSPEGHLNITISRQDIAAFAGTSYETVFKTFSEWINTGIILTEGKRIQLLKDL